MKFKALQVRYRLALVAAALSFTYTGTAQTKTAPSADLSWIRDFAVPATPETTARDQAGEQNKLNWDPRFQALLTNSSHQRQSFWFDHYRFTPLPALVQQFMGVPGRVLLEEDRYVTVNGCVPHDCSDRGMLWIDTGTTKKPCVIFAATGQVSQGLENRYSQIHLWLFSSTKLDWSKLPPPFRSSLIAWWNKTTAVWRQDSPEKIILVTLVQPSGEMVDLAPSLLAFADPDTTSTEAQH